jgi:tetratricopeptide (TPR) repeat protein
MNRFILLLTFAVLFQTFTVFCQDTDPEKPVWVLLEKAESEMKAGEFGSAMQIYREVIELEGSIPEAEAGIARIFKEEGDFRLAEMQYKTALSLSKNFYILEDKYTVLYELASIYRIEKKYREFEETLLLVIQDDEEFSADRNQKLNDAMIRVLKEQGIDKLITLYRMKTTFSLSAHVHLGTFYCRSGRYDQSIKHLVYSLLSTLTVIIDEFKISDPDFEFSGLKPLVEDALSHSRLEDYILDHGLYQSIYYLAASLFAEGFQTESKKLWRTLYEIQNSGDWSYRSGNQLENPHIEPLLVYE